MGAGGGQDRGEQWGQIGTTLNTITIIKNKQNRQNPCFYSINHNFGLIITKHVIYCANYVLSSSSEADILVAITLLQE